MKHQPNTTITKPSMTTAEAVLDRPEDRAMRAPRARSIASEVCSFVTRMCILLTLAAPIFAHGGFDHVIGTVSKVDNGTVTVKTTRGEVSVKVIEKTEITRGDQKAGIADVKPGIRVVIDVPEGSKDHVAHSIKLGAASSEHK